MNIFLDAFSSLLTLDKLTFLLALFGSIGTFFSWLYIFIQNRKKIEVKVLLNFMPTNESFVFYMQFINKSRLPISICSIHIINNNELTPCSLVPDDAVQISKMHFMTAEFPLYLPPLGGYAGYIQFVSPLKNLPLDARNLTFLIGTNRGKAVEMILPIPPGHED